MTWNVYIKGGVMAAKVCAIFGGCGFIGAFWAKELLESRGFNKIIFLDVKGISYERFGKILGGYLAEGLIEYVYCDVRLPINEQVKLPENISLIANFAAVHREPGHKPEEYFKTNVLGAENVCLWADLIGCNNILFTSSIAPYGTQEIQKSEATLPIPSTPYGSSKLVAEKVHQSWARSSNIKNLVIVRPGVVFGPGEGGNVSRLIRATIKGYFFYMGNKSTRKAGIYVRELTSAMFWCCEAFRDDVGSLVLVNMSMSPSPSVQEYVAAIQEVKGCKRFVMSLPFNLLYPASFLIEIVSRLFAKKQPISPVRLRKLVKSNDIVPQYLLDQKYEFKYSLLSAMQEWKDLSPEDWDV